jgi:RNA polymerase sigma factor (sigma-70 family)
MALPEDPIALDNIRQLIRRKAAKLARRPEFHPQETEDLEQDLFVDLFQRLARFDPKKGDLSFFLHFVLDHMIANKIRDQGARTRRSGAQQSLEQRTTATSGETVRLAEVVSEDDLDARTGRARGDTERQAELAANIAELFPRLDPALREVAELLMLHPKAEVARRLGVPRTSLCTAVKRLRKIFEDGDLREFL